MLLVIIICYIGLIFNTSLKLISLDTIEFTSSTDFIRDMKFDKFVYSEVSKPNGLKFKNYSLDKMSLGLSKFIVSDFNSTFKCRLSSKILGCDYIQGLTIDNILKLNDTLSNHSIKLDEDFINYSTLNHCDIKSDLNLSKSSSVYLNSLSFLNAYDFTKTVYPHGITFNQNVIRNKLRATIYSKDYELKSNSKFYNQYPELIKDFDNVIRFESRFSTKTLISKYFNSLHLLDVLNSIDVNYNVFSKIIDNQTNFKPYYNLDNMTNTQEKNFAHIYMLNEMYNGDFNKIMNHIKNKLSKNTKASYQRSKVKEYLSIINNDSQSRIDDILEFHNALKNN